MKRPDNLVLPKEVMLTAMLKQPARSVIKMFLMHPSVHKETPNIAAEFQRAHKDDTTILVADLDESNNWCVESWNLTSAKSERLLVRITTSKTDSDRSKLVWAYDSGLLCVFGTDSCCLHLCNPASGQFKTLPPPPFLCDRGLADTSMFPTVFYLSGAPVTSMASNYKLLAVAVKTSAFAIFWKSSTIDDMGYYLLKNQTEADLTEPEWIKVTTKGLPRHIPQEGSVCIGSALYFPAYICPGYCLMKLDLVSKSIGSFIELPKELSSPALTVLDSTYTLINHVGKVGIALRDVRCSSAFRLWILSGPGDWIPISVSTEIFNQDPLVNHTVSFEGSLSDGRLVFNLVEHYFFTKPTEESVLYYDLQDSTYTKHKLPFQRSSSAIIIWNRSDTIQIL